LKRTLKKMDHRKKLCIVISNIDKALSFEWLTVALKDKYDLSYILLNAEESRFEKFLVQECIKFNRVKYTGKRDLISAFFKVLKIFIRDRPAIIHANYFDAELISLPAAWLTGVKTRIYTRHHSNYHQDYFPHIVKYDKLCNWLSTQIISISQATDKTLIELEDVPPGKVVKVYHGLKFSNLLDVTPERISIVRNRWAISNKAPIIGVIARYEKLKGYQYIIPAFKKYLLHSPDSVLVMANAKGPYQTEVIKMLDTLPTKSYILIPFEADIAALYHTFNIYIHAPIDEMCEAFGLTYIEALALGIPSIFTRSGIAKEFIVDDENAITVNFKCEEDIYKSLIKLSSDADLMARLSLRGKEDVKKLFDFDDYIQKLQRIYL
jgi:glycosyltransferase involved in cell wall biosynthesis